MIANPDGGLATNPHAPRPVRDLVGTITRAFGDDTGPRKKATYAFFRIEIGAKIADVEMVRLGHQKEGGVRYWIERTAVR